MISFLAVPKPFTNPHTALIQRNAILSWKQLSPDHVYLFGNDEGVKDFAVKNSLDHVIDIGLSKEGTPLLNWVFDYANSHCQSEILVFINSDIILTKGFLDTLYEVIRLKEFLMVGRRTDLDTNDDIDFSKADWVSNVTNKAKASGQLHSEHGMDYFVFRRGLFHDIPPFRIGRAGYDNWLIYKARTSGVPVIDATNTCLAIHQNHDYSHYKGGKMAAYRGIEAQINHRLANSGKAMMTLFDASHFTDQKNNKVKILSTKCSSFHAFKYYWLWTFPKIHSYLGFPIERVRSYFDQQILKKMADTP